MDELIAQLPGGLAAVVIVAYIAIKEIAPRINRSRKTSTPPPPHPPMLLPSSGPTAAETERWDRFERVFMEHLESDRRQLAILTSMADRMAEQGRAIQAIADTLTEVRTTMRAQGQVLEAVFRRQLDDTGRFAPVDPRR